MTTDEQNDNTLGNPSDETQPQPAVGAVEAVAGGQSRRKFLRLAVVSGATVATVGATAGIAAAHPHTGILTNLGITNPFGASAQGNCSMCFENSGFDQINNEFDVHGGHASPGDFYLWFTGKNLAPGTYTITISPDPGTSPFTYSGSGSAKLYQLTAGGAGSAVDCPSGLPKDKADVKADTVSGIGSYTFSGSNADLQLAVHFKWDGTTISGDHTYTFTTTLSNASGTVCTASVKVTAHGDA